METLRYQERYIYIYIHTYIYIWALNFGTNFSMIVGYAKSVHAIAAYKLPAVKRW